MQKLKKLILIGFLLISSIGLTNPKEVKANNYVQFENSVYYVPSEIKNIYDVKLPQIANPLDWILNTNSFTIIKNKKIIPTPNIQQLAKNEIVKDFPQGYSTYNSNKNLFSNGNVILPSPLYFGESPLTFLSTNHILPNNFWDGLWRGIRGLFGASFTNAPNKDTLNTITNINADYFSFNSDLLDKLVEPMKIFHKNLQKQWSTFDTDYIPVEEKEKAELRISNLIYEDKTGEEAYKVVLKKKTDYENGDGYTYQSLKGALKGENGYSGNKDYIIKFNEWQGSIDELLGKSIEEIEQIGGYPDYTSYKYPFNEVFGEKENEIIEIYNQSKARIAEYNSFVEKFNKTGADSFSQCLIKSTEDKKCIDNRLGQETSFFIGNVHSLNPTVKTFNTEGITRNTLIRYLQTVKSQTGVYYSEVLGNLLISIQNHYKKETGKTIDFSTDTLREIPYDRETMVDKDSYSVSDPRNDIYKQFFLGHIVSNLSIVSGINEVINYFRLQPTILNFIGVISHLNIFLNEFVGFKIFEENGLSPIDNYNIGLIQIAMAVLILYFIFTTIKNIISFFKGKGGFFKTLIQFLVLILELGFLTLLMIQPQKTWETVKKPIELVLTLGDEVTVKNDETLSYLVQDSGDIYKMNYYDAWSKYNVGYGLLDKENYIDMNKKLPETEKLILPKINNQPIQHWSMLLADSFNFYGESHDMNAITDTETGKQINGIRPNYNVYRVVDHFLSPRITVKENEGIKSIEVTQNENYNGQFQKPLFILVIILIASIFILFVNLIKVLTFMFFWFNLYTLFYQVVIKKISEKLKWSEIFSSLFLPLLQTVIIGLFNGFIIYSIMRISQPLILLIWVFGLFILLKVTLIWWEKQKSFPTTLTPIIWLINWKNKKEEHQYDMEADTMVRESIQVGLKLDRNDMYGSLFTESGEMKHKEAKYATVYKDYMNTLKQKQKLGKKLTPNEDRAIQVIKGSQVARDDDNTTKPTTTKPPKSIKIKNEGGGL